MTEHYNFEKEKNRQTWTFADSTTIPTNLKSHALKIEQCPVEVGPTCSDGLL
jgi:hypothetical protein